MTFAPFDTRDVSEWQRELPKADEEFVLVDHNATSLTGSSPRNAEHSNLAYQPIPEEDRYHLATHDQEGESKVSPTGGLSGGRASCLKMFHSQHRDDKPCMPATECTRIIGYRNKDLFFSQNQSLDKIIATQQDEDELIHQGILPHWYRSRELPSSVLNQYFANKVPGALKQAVALETTFGRTNLSERVYLRKIWRVTLSAGVVKQRRRLPRS